MKLLVEHREFDTKIANIVYSYADRKNGWYFYRVNAAGDQIGDAEYRYTKNQAIVDAADLASYYYVDVIRL